MSKALNILFTIVLCTALGACEKCIECYKYSHDGDLLDHDEYCGSGSEREGFEDGYLLTAIQDTAVAACKRD